MTMDLEPTPDAAPHQGNGWICLTYSTDALLPSGERLAVSAEFAAEQFATAAAAFNNPAMRARVDQMRVAMVAQTVAQFGPAFGTGLFTYGSHSFSEAAPMDIATQ